MKNIIILGAGTGGTLLSNMLSGKLDRKEWAITIIDRSHEHHYQPGCLFIPFRLYGYEDRSDIARDIHEPLPKNVNFVKALVERIDHEKRQVKTTAGDFDYDWLISTLGCRIVPEEVSGMAEAMGQDVYTFYTLDGALEFQTALDRMHSGRLVINIADMPIKCPVAPIEFAFLADYYFHLKGVRDDVEISLVTPFSGAFTKPNANRILTRIAQQKNIHVIPNFSIERVDAENHCIHSFEGERVDYDLLCAIPPNLGPEVIDDSGLGDGTGYGLTDPRTLKSKKAERIYFMGDNSNVATSKAGSVAHFETETVVENLLREINGEKPLPSFDGHANCFIESGYHKALLLDFNYDMEPLEGSFPMPAVGPFSLLKESHMNHIGKIAFDWVYWHMLLPGYLPMVPLLPSQMNFVGKDLTTAPEIRRSKALKVKDIMTTGVLTVQTGTSLSKAAAYMAEHNVSSLPVVDVDNRLIGIITESDFLAALNINEDSAVTEMFDMIIRRKRPAKTRGTSVDGLMTRNPITIKEDDTVNRAIQIMEKNRIKRLVITDAEHHVHGIISRPDLMSLYMAR
ncbi:MAG: CBS domain-containing protein [gamma proteobacterium symbiont of Bathyaustriella thionipta]|nr:CBS domain-containing protein [gamma proteobacterium symbiont of Bathyaustriella thionipta]